MELLDALFVWLPEREVDAMIIDKADFQVIILFLNLAWFLIYQMVLRRLTRTTFITIYTVGTKPYHRFSKCLLLKKTEEVF